MEVDGQTLTAIDDLSRQVGLQGTVELAFESRQVLQLAQMMANPIPTGHSAQELARMFDAVLTARRPKQYFTQALSAKLSLGIEV